ncbi:copper amine oxidase N-terminal domain-containing protein [Paenibacillus herberti]|uniref:Copper amine oxidase-like N-terminal domain-containing protein n=1 Tax=Paenibacillus herberti TaxID=1619309 RepID=A0A229NY30_9BACL|nr:copper amine oxidase N-terminal domain-containing protein [Paenibacillus herberti]OXM14780.1 hypothetical protein CGZ75_18070 [Paenibacillus herberti]
MKKIWLIVILALLLIPGSLAYGEQKRVVGTVVIDGTTLKDTALVVNGNTMIPFRELFENLGMTVQWYPKKKIVIAEGADIKIVLTMGVSTVTINEKIVPLTQSPFHDSLENKFLVNTRVVAEAVGGTVDWDNIKKVATITSK